MLAVSWKSMKRLGIRGYARKQKNPESKDSKDNGYENLLNTKFYAEKPMQKLLTDVTYIKPLRKLKIKLPVQYRFEQAT